jgi:hypothetical protein
MADDINNKFKEIVSYRITELLKRDDVDQPTKDAWKKENDEAVGLLKGLEKEVIAYSDARLASGLLDANASTQTVEERLSMERTAREALENGILKHFGKERPEGLTSGQGQTMDDALSLTAYYADHHIKDAAKQIKQAMGAEIADYAGTVNRYNGIQDEIKARDMAYERLLITYEDKVLVESFKLGIPKEQLSAVDYDLFQRLHGEPGSPELAKWSTPLAEATKKETDAIKASTIPDELIIGNEKAAQAVDISQKRLDAKFQDLTRQYAPAERAAIRQELHLPEIVSYRTPERAQDRKQEDPGQDKPVAFNEGYLAAPVATPAHSASVQRKASVLLS